MSLVVTLAVDGREVLASHALRLSTCREGSLRLGDGVAKLSLCDSTLEVLLQDDEGESIASVLVQPPMDAEAWQSMPGGCGANKCSLAVDVPGFTVCFDAV